MIDKAQLLLTMGSMVLFSFLVMNVNESLFENNYLQVVTEVQYNAIALGEDIVNAARWKSFSSIDDYNGYSKIDTVASGIYKVNAQVVYVSLANTDSVSTAPTNHKKLMVTVTNQNMTKPITLSYIKNR